MTFVIAEIGSAWRYVGEPERQLKKLHEAIRMAKSAHANAFKCQWTSDPRKMEARRQVPEGTYDILAWPQDLLNDAAAYCEEVGIEFMCTVFLPWDVPVIHPLVRRYKLASLEYQDASMWMAFDECPHPVICSIGCCTEAEVYKMVHRRGPRDHVLQCVAAYPCKPEDLNLNTIGVLCDGLSDHTANVETGALAVMRGARVIEVHFKLSHTPPSNPDYGHSLDPQRLRMYVENIRKAEKMLGDGKKKILPSEEPLVKHRVMIST